MNKDEEKEQKKLDKKLQQAIKDARWLLDYVDKHSQDVVTARKIFDKCDC